MSRTVGRGRRPGAPDTRGAILEAARSSFADRGFAGTTIRGVAAEAGVDPALVHHYFGSKEDLFLAALEVPIDPREVVRAVFAEGLEGAAERLLRTFLPVWDDPVRQRPLVAMFRTGLSNETGHEMLRSGLMRMVLRPAAEVLGARGGGEAEGIRRAQLAATQMLGLVAGRYVMRLEPLASMPREELVAWLAPTLQRYFTGDLPETAS